MDKNYLQAIIDIDNQLKNQTKAKRLNYQK